MSMRFILTDMRDNKCVCNNESCKRKIRLMLWNRKRLKQMAEKTLVVHDGSQLHKTGLLPRSPKNITIGNDWADSMTFLSVEQSISIRWDGETCFVEEERLETSRELSFSNGITLSFYLLSTSEIKLLDIAGKSHLAISKNIFDDITVENIDADIVLFREKRGFRLEEWHSIP